MSVFKTQGPRKRPAKIRNRKTNWRVSHNGRSQSTSQRYARETLPA